MNTRRDAFQAIADPTRRAILTLLAVQALTPGAIAEHFNSSRQTISRHIQVLTECNLVKQTRNGREILYRVDGRGLEKVANFIEPFRAMWEERFNKLEQVMKKYNGGK
jgi:DNA-binding transcriptional ArsR family regulator